MASCYSLDIGGAVQLKAVSSSKGKRPLMKGVKASWGLSS